MEIYEEYVVWDHEILVGFYVAEGLKARFDAVCRSEGSRNGQVLAELMNDYVAMHEATARQDEEHEATVTSENLAAFLDQFGAAKPTGRKQSRK